MKDKIIYAIMYPWAVLIDKLFSIGGRPEEYQIGVVESLRLARYIKEKQDRRESRKVVEISNWMNR